MNTAPLFLFDEVTLQDLPQWLASVPTTYVELWEASSLSTWRRPSVIQCYRPSRAISHRFIGDLIRALANQRSEAHETASFAVLAFPLRCAAPRRAIIVGPLRRRGLSFDNTCIPLGDSRTARLCTTIRRSPESPTRSRPSHVYRSLPRGPVRALWLAEWERAWVAFPETLDAPTIPVTAT